jgi:hypothetical protein
MSCHCKIFQDLFFRTQGKILPGILSGLVYFTGSVGFVCNFVDTLEQLSSTGITGPGLILENFQRPCNPQKQEMALHFGGPQHCLQALDHPGAMRLGLWAAGRHTRSEAGCQPTVATGIQDEDSNFRRYCRLFMASTEDQPVAQDEYDDRFCQAD